MMRTFRRLSLGMMALAAAAQTLPPVTVTGSITVSGPAVGGTRTVALGWMNNFVNKGDWYVTPTEAHAAFFVSDASMMQEGRIDLELNGPAGQTTYILNHANCQNRGKKTDLGFGVTVGTAQKSTQFTPEDDDQVTVTVKKWDALSFEAAVEGRLTQSGLMERNGHDAYRVQVSGAIRLHRDREPARINAGAYPDCDPMVHDWLNQAQNRAPSECEVKFDHSVRSAIPSAFEPAFAAFAAQQWRVEKSPRAGTIDGLPRGSEKEPFLLGAADFDVKFSLTLDPATPEYQRLKAAADTPDPALTKAMELMKQGKYAEAQAAARQATPGKALAELRGASEIHVTPSINRFELAMVNFHGAFTAEPLPGGGTVLSLPEAQPATGGGEGEPATWVLLGPWGPASAAKLDQDASKVTIQAKKNPSAPRLAVQTVVVFLRASRPMAARLIAGTDWSRLRAMIGH